MSDQAKYKQLMNNLLCSINWKNYDQQTLKSYMTELIKISFSSFLVDDNVIIVLVNNLCVNLRTEHTELIKLNSKFLTMILKNGVTFDNITFAVCHRWIRNNLKHSDVAVHNEILLAVQSLINFGSWDVINKEYANLFEKEGSLWEYLNPKPDEWNERNVLALSCLENFFIKATHNELSELTKYLPSVRDIVMNILCDLPYKVMEKEALFNKTACLSLRISQILVSNTEASTWPSRTGQILGILQVYLFHGIKGYDFIKPEVLRPAPMNLPEREQIVSKRNNFSQHKTRDRKQRIKKNAGEKNVDSKPSFPCSSDSETSDSELAAPMDWKVRLRAVQLFQTLSSSVSSTEMFGYWTQIIAIGSGNNPRVLSRWLLKVRDSKSRQLALTSLAELIEEAKKFLLHAEEVEHSSFVPIFGMVGEMIKELHSTLSLLSSRVHDKLVLTQILKCAEALAQNTPYSRMKPGLATKLINNCRSHLRHSDPTIRVAVLLVFEAIASTDPMTKEISTILEKASVRDIDDLHLNISAISGESDIELEADEQFHDQVESFSSFELENDSEEKSLSSLVWICLHNVSTQSIHEPVRTQSLKLLATIISNAENLVFPHLEVVTAALLEGMQASDYQIVFHSCRVVEIASTRLSTPEFSHLDPFIIWNPLFDRIVALAQHPQVLLREVMCNCLSSLGSNMLSRLPRQKIILIVTILLSSAKDEESAVRAAGIRALGVLVSTSVLEEDTGFLMDLMHVASDAMKDENVGVRVKASWALASLSDCLLRRECNTQVEPVSLETVLPKLYEISVTAAKDNNKVKSNAVRALGTIFALSSEKEILKDTSAGLDALISCASKGSDMKLRWNACHALGVVLSKKPDLFLPISWKDKVFPTLCSLISNLPNFKVRINAAWALSVCTSFGKYIPMMWKSIISALENSRHVPNYIEYAHHDNLVQQLCLALCHVILHTELNDLNSIWSEIGEQVKDISPFIQHFQLHVLPEKSGNLMNAKIRCDNHLKSASTCREKEIAETLIQLFGKPNAFDKVDTF